MGTRTWSMTASASAGKATLAASAPVGANRNASASGKTLISETSRKRDGGSPAFQPPVCHRQRATMVSHRMVPASVIICKFESAERARATHQTACAVPTAAHYRPASSLLAGSTAPRGRSTPLQPQGFKTWPSFACAHRATKGDPSRLPPTRIDPGMRHSEARCKAPSNFPVATSGADRANAFPNLCCSWDVFWRVQPRRPRTSTCAKAKVIGEGPAIHAASAMLSTCAICEMCMLVMNTVMGPTCNCL